MCLIIFAHQPGTRFPLIVAANRDEFYARPTRQADFWPDAAPHPLLAGKDLRAGGTWLGITGNGRFAAVTNIRDPSQQEQKPRSRGELTLAFLQSSISPRDYADQLQTCFDEFAGFNLLVGDRESLFYLNNQARVSQRLTPGVHGLSNGLLNSDWPKVTRGRERLQTLLQTSDGPDSDQLITMMHDRQPAPDAELPSTGVPLALERQLSAAFIQNTERRYGTLCSTAIILEDSGHCRFAEQNYDVAGDSSAGHFYRFPLQD